MEKRTITLIEPMTNDKPISIAAYARVSSASEEQLASFKSQYEYYSNYVKEMDNAILVDIYCDKGITGTSIEKRTDFKRMIMDCELGKIDRIVTKSITRFARNLVETLRIVRELKVLGVSILFEEENINTSNSTGELELTMFAFASELESKTIAYNQRWAFRSRAKEGIFNQSSMPYGYYRNNSEIQIHEEEAVIIKMLFDMYVNQEQSTVTIERYFNNHQIGGRKWLRFGIMMMLENERYCGDMLLQKKYTTDDFPYKEVRNKGEMPQYYVYDSFPAIISRDMYEKSKERLKKTRENLTTNQLGVNRKYDYTSKIKCSHCGTTFKRRIIRGKEEWICQKHYVNKDECIIKRITKHELDEAFLKVFYKLKNHTYILQTYVNQIKNLTIDEVSQEKINAIDGGLQQLAKEKEWLVNAYANNQISTGDYQVRLNNNKYRKTEKELQKRDYISEIIKDADILETRIMIDFLETVEDIDKFDIDVFNMLIERIEVGETDVCFILKNNLQITIGRRIFNGNYS